MLREGETVLQRHVASPDFEGHQGPNQDLRFRRSKRNVGAVHEADEGGAALYGGKVHGRVSLSRDCPL